MALSTAKQLDFVVEVGDSFFLVSGRITSVLEPSQPATYDLCAYQAGTPLIAQTDIHTEIIQD